MNQLPSLKKIHIFAIAAGILLVGIFFWSTLSTLAFNGPTENPSGGNGAIGTDASNNVYIGGNLNVTGTITASDLGGSTLNAANISSGEFGDNTGGGEYDFPSTVGVGEDSPGGDFDAALSIEDTGNGDLGEGILAINPSDLSWTNGEGDPGDLVLGATNGIELSVNSGQAVNLEIASGTGYVGIGTTNPLSILDVFGGQLLVRDNDNGANYGTGIRIGYDGSSGFGSASIGFRTVDQSERFEIVEPSSSVNTANERISIAGDCSGACPMTEYFSVNRYGDVGIDTTTSTNPLTVAGNIYATGNITCGGTCGGGGSSQWTTTSTGIYYNGGTVDIGAYYEETNPVYLGPGTTNGIAQTYSSGSYYTDALIGAGTGGNSTAFRVMDGSTELMRINANGDLGIGTTNPGYPLTVNGDIYASTNGSDAQVTVQRLNNTNNASFSSGPNGTLSGTNPDWYAGLHANSADYTIFDYDGSTTHSYVTVQASSGYVGIGTTSPGYLLTVSGNADITGNLIVGSGSGIINTNVITSQYYQDPTQTAAYLQFANGGGTSYFNERGDTSTTGFQMLGAAGQTGAILQVTSSSNAVYLDVSAAGNVGIGTSTPSQALTVGNSNQFTVSSAGNVTSTGNITAGSFNLTDDATTASTISTTGKIGNCASSSVTISGAVTSTGAVFVSPVTYPGTGLWWDGYVSAPNTVVIMECAATTTTVTASKFNAIYIY